MRKKQPSGGWAGVGGGVCEDRSGLFAGDAEVGEDLAEVGE